MQIVRHFVKDWLEEKSPPFGTIGRWAVVFDAHARSCLAELMIAVV